MIRGRKIKQVIGIVPLTVVGLSGVVKLLDLPIVVQALDTWTIIPKGFVPWIRIAIPVIEVVAWFAWSFEKVRAATEKWTLGLLLVYTIGYLIQSIVDRPPNCGCLGLIAAYEASRQEAWLLVIRNALLAGACLLSIMLNRPASLHPQRCGPTLPSSTQGSRSAFALIELILVVAFVAILLALLAPSLDRMRTSARSAKSVALAGQHALVFGMYAQDQRDVYPALTDPQATWSILRCQATGAAAQIPYFGLWNRWPVGLADSYYNGQHRRSVLYSPLAEDSKGLDADSPTLYTSYAYPCAFIARPEYWNPGTREAPDKQLAGTRVDEVLFPMHKALIVDRDGYWALSAMPGLAVSFRERATLPAAFADGSAAKVRVGRAEAWGMVSADGDYDPWTQQGHQGEPALHTIDGARGRDVNSR